MRLLSHFYSLHLRKKKEGRINLKLIICHLKIEARHTLSPPREHLLQGKLKKRRKKKKEKKKRLR